MNRSARRLTPRPATPSAGNTFAPSLEWLAERELPAGLLSGLGTVVNTAVAPVAEAVAPLVETLPPAEVRADVGAVAVAADVPLVGALLPNTLAVELGPVNLNAAAAATVAEPAASAVIGVELQVGNVASLDVSLALLIGPAEVNVTIPDVGVGPITVTVPPVTVDIHPPVDTPPVLPPVPPSPPASPPPASPPTPNEPGPGTGGNGGGETTPPITGPTGPSTGNPPPSTPPGPGDTGTTTPLPPSDTTPPLGSSGTTTGPAEPTGATPGGSAAGGNGSTSQPGEFGPDLGVVFGGVAVDSSAEGAANLAPEAVAALAGALAPTFVIAANSEATAPTTPGAFDASAAAAGQIFGSEGQTAGDESAALPPAAEGAATPPAAATEAPPAGAQLLPGVADVIDQFLPFDPAALRAEVDGFLAALDATLPDAEDLFFEPETWYTAAAVLVAGYATWRRVRVRRTRYATATTLLCPTFG